VLRTGRRRALADRIVADVLAVRGPDEAARVLAACGADVVAAQLPALGHLTRLRIALARIHPEVVLDDSARQLAELPRSAREQWWWRHARSVFATVDRHPHRVLDLIERHGPREVLPFASIAWIPRLLTADHERVLRLLVEAERIGPTVSRLSTGAVRRVVDTRSPTLVDLGRELRRDDASLVRLMRMMPPSRRAAFHDAVNADRDVSRAVLGDAVLAVLPRERRYVEVRRMLTLPHADAHESQRLALLAHLPLNEVRAELVATTRRPDAVQRAAGYRRLIACAAAGGDAAGFGALLRSLSRLRNEQDPVRRAALRAVAEADPRLFDHDVADVLAEFARDALEARDTSHQTRTHITDLASRLLTHHLVGGAPELTGWALGTFEGVAAQAGWVRLHDIGVGLRRGREHEIHAALRPWIAAQDARGDYWLAFALAAGLGKRARDIDELQETLGRATRSKNVSVARIAIEHWLDDPRSRTERAVELVARDPSTAALPVVLRTIAAHRPDLLDPYLTGLRLRGRFVPDHTRWVPYLPFGCLERLLPRQQRAYAKLMVELVEDTGQHGYTRVGALRHLARIPEFGRAELLGYVDSADVTLVEAALIGLTHTTDPAAALPILLAHVDDDRARVAIHAASRAARYTAPSVLASLLRPVLLGTGKVTSRKEAVRIAVREGIPGAVALAAQVWQAENQHRDVRGAVLDALLDRLGDEPSWAVLHAAVEGPRELTTTVLHTSPSTIAPALRPRFAALVTSACESTDPEVLRGAYRAFPGWASWSPGGVTAIRDAVLNLSDRATWSDAVQALHAFTADGVAPGVLVDVVESLIALETSGAGPDAEADRDHPARRRLAALLRASRAWAHRQPATAEPILRPVLAVLAHAPELRTEAAVTTAATIPLDDADTADRLTALAELCADRVVPALAASDELHDRLGQPHTSFDRDVLLRAVRTLALGPSAPAGVIAYGITRSVGPASGWPDRWRTVIRTLRAHPDPDVREFALNLATATE
ncbi:hypothetical protein, partial [Streptomyces sp. SID3343]|uniref:hypothetical protein n=1 Tax=Streptomyces sp. SID3343 TaxID=2690260 RepID=UPI001367C06C